MQDGVDKLLVLEKQARNVCAPTEALALHWRNR